MKIVLNVFYGRFRLPEKFCKLYGMDQYDNINRTDERLISFVEENRGIERDCFLLRVIEIPDTTTDWEIVEHDGIENLTYVVDGKIYHVE